MKRTIFVVLVLVCVTSSPLLAQQPVPQEGTEKKVVAVLPFTSPSIYSEMGYNAQSTFITKLVNERKVRVIQANMVSRMLRQHGLHWTGTIEPTILKAAGRWLKAEYVLAGKLRWGGDAYILSAHVMDVNTLETVFAEDIDFRDSTKMRIAVRALAPKIAAIISGAEEGGAKATSSSKSQLFLNVDPRAFYDTSDACIQAMGYIVQRFGFTGTVDSVDESSKTLRAKGDAGRLQVGTPLDVFSSNDSLDGPSQVTTVYVTKMLPNGFEAQYRSLPSDGIALEAKISSSNHKYIVAVGKIEDEVEDHEDLVNKFRSALLEKMSEGSSFQQVETPVTDLLAQLSSRQTRFSAFSKLFQKGVEIVLEGKFYGSAGSRRAHFKIYSTMTGKILGEPKFETSL